MKILIFLFLLTGFYSNSQNLNLKDIEYMNFYGSEEMIKILNPEIWKVVATGPEDEGMYSDVVFKSEDGLLIIYEQKCCVHFGNALVYFTTKDNFTKILDEARNSSGYKSEKREIGDNSIEYIFTNGDNIDEYTFKTLKAVTLIGDKEKYYIEISPHTLKLKRRYKQFE